MGQMWVSILSESFVCDGTKHESRPTLCGSHEGPHQGQELQQLLDLQGQQLPHSGVGPSGTDSMVPQAQLLSLSIRLRVNARCCVP